VTEIQNSEGSPREFDFLDSRGNLIASLSNDVDRSSLVYTECVVILIFTRSMNGGRTCVWLKSSVDGVRGDLWVAVLGVVQQLRWGAMVD
jgi:hypothetical protein